MTRLESRLLQFMSAHEHEVTNALEIHVRDMTELARGARAHYEAIKDLPEREPVHRDGFISVEPTTRGYLNIAQAFTEAAERAGKALDAFGKLAEMTEEL